MKIIRDEEFGGVMMIPLFVDWHVRRCNVKGCTNEPNTIVQGLAPGIPLCGFCEEHFQEANTPDGTNFTLEFDDFDAFAQEES
jgi:hypothetical protein